VDQVSQELQRNRETILALQADLRGLSAQRVGVERTAEGEQFVASATVGETSHLLAQLEMKLQASSRIVSSHAGRVLEIRADRGRIVSPGASIVTLEVASNEAAELEAVLYAFSGDGKKIRPGMEVHLSPSVARRELDGVLIGQVAAVAEFPATRAGMMHVLHNEQLVEDFLTATQGAPIAIHARLVLDRGTASGYRWSSGHGPDLQLTAGTPCTASVTTRRDRPIALLLAHRR
jgi:HlyD family secretion protein